MPPRDCFRVHLCKLLGVNGRDLRACAFRRFFFLRRERQREGKSRATSELTRSRNRSAVRLNQVLHDSQPKTGAFSLARAGLVSSIEPFEYSREIRCRYPRSGVFYTDRHSVVALFGGYVNRAIRAIEFHRVVDKVIKYLLKPGAIGLDPQMCGNRSGDRYLGVR